MFLSLQSRTFWPILYSDLLLSKQPHLWQIYWRLRLWKWRRRLQTRYTYTQEIGANTWTLQCYLFSSFTYINLLWLKLLCLPKTDENFMPLPWYSISKFCNMYSCTAEKLVKAPLAAVPELSFHSLFNRHIWAVGERYGPPPSWWEGVVGGHRWHRRACHPGGLAAGSAAALPPQAEGQAEQHADCLLFHQPHCQLRIRCSRYGTEDIVNKTHQITINQITQYVSVTCCVCIFCVCFNNSLKLQHYIYNENNN